VFEIVSTFRNDVRSTIGENDFRTVSVVTSDMETGLVVDRESTGHLVKVVKSSLFDCSMLEASRVDSVLSMNLSTVSSSVIKSKSSDLGHVSADSMIAVRETENYVVNATDILDRSAMTTVVTESSDIANSRVLFESMPDFELLQPVNVAVEPVAERNETDLNAVKEIVEKVKRPFSVTMRAK